MVVPDRDKIAMRMFQAQEYSRSGVFTSLCSQVNIFFPDGKSHVAGRMNEQRYSAMILQRKGRRTPASSCLAPQINSKAGKRQGSWMVRCVSSLPCGPFARRMFATASDLRRDDGMGRTVDQPRPGRGRQLDCPFRPPVALHLQCDLTCHCFHVRGFDGD